MNAYFIITEYITVYHIRLLQVLLTYFMNLGDRSCLDNVKANKLVNFLGADSLIFYCNIEWSPVNKKVDLPSISSLFSVSSEFDFQSRMYI